jgi:hypothetical protein
MTDPQKSNTQATKPRRVPCPSCGRTFNCDGTAECWCLNVDRHFDYEEFFIRTGQMSCVCPVCLTGKTPI